MDMKVFQTVQMSLLRNLELYVQICVRHKSIIKQLGITVSGKK